MDNFSNVDTLDLTRSVYPLNLNILEHYDVLCPFYTTINEKERNRGVEKSCASGIYDISGRKMEGNRNNRIIINCGKKEVKR